MKYLFYICFLLLSFNTYSQSNADSENTSAPIYIKGSVLLKESNDPISKVQIKIEGKSYTQTSLSGDFRIKANIGDEIIISHPDIETVSYIVQAKNDKLKIIVKQVKIANKNLKQKYTTATQQFNKLISQAEKSYKKDASKGIQEITNALLLNNTSKKQEARAYGVLGDIHLFWKQYDLAISNYKSSLKRNDNNVIKLKLAKSFFKNGDLDIAKLTYQSIKTRNLSHWLQINLHEELGDVYTAQNDFKNSEKSYQNGLTIAKKHLITPKITDLNSKLGKLSFTQGNVNEANTYFNNSLDLASEENKQRSTVEKERVADFYNSNREFDKEIELRKNNLSTLETLNDEVITENRFLEKDSITTQKTNYKIASAYVQQEKYEEAIPYLKESISQANKKNDLIIEKDATRKLSEIYKAVGNNVEALNNYQSYVILVDKLYIQKEQEIANASKFSRDLAKKQQRIVGLENERKLSENKLLISSKDQQLIASSNTKQRLFIYSLLAGILLLSLLAFFMYRNNKQQKLNNNLLALRSLRSQMNPHFIFNALNSVNSFISSNDERTANRYLTDFSKLMRAVLENSEEDFIPLEKELELLQLYTKLEHFRFEDKFDYSINIDSDIDINKFAIPPMLLQPYVENAVWHGLRYKKEKGNLDISILKINEEIIQIEISDNGIGRQKSKALKTQNQQKHQSKGLGNIQKRVSILNKMYQDKVDVFIEDIINEGGTKVVLTLKRD